MDMDTHARRAVEAGSPPRRPAPAAENDDYDVTGYRLPTAEQRAGETEESVRARFRAMLNGESEPARELARPMTGFFGTLSPAQQEAAQPNRGPEKHGDLAFRNRGPYIATYTGRFYPFDPRPEDVRIDDIAHSLASIVRYTGHGQREYRVAEHSVHIARWLRSQGWGADTQLAGLLHDAPEALSGFGDVARPAKSRAPIIKETEDAIYRRAVAPAFGLSPDIPAAVHEADMRICADEMTQNMREVDPNVGPCLGITLCYWSQAVAEGTFIGEFRRLMDERFAEGQRRVA